MRPRSEGVLETSRRREVYNLVRRLRDKAAGKLSNKTRAEGSGTEKVTFSKLVNVTDPPLVGTSTKPLTSPDSSVGPSRLSISPVSVSIVIGPGELSDTVTSSSRDPPPKPSINIEPVVPFTSRFTGALVKVVDDPIDPEPTPLNLNLNGPAWAEVIESPMAKASETIIVLIFIFIAVSVSCLPTAAQLPCHTLTHC